MQNGPCACGRGFAIIFAIATLFSLWFVFCKETSPYDFKTHFWNPRNVSLQKVNAVRESRNASPVGSRWKCPASSLISPKRAKKRLPPWTTNCPDAKWVDEMVITDPVPGKTIVNIGCNKGNDVIHWMERWDMSTSHFWSQSRWTNQIAKSVPNMFFACPPSEKYVTASMAKSESSSQYPVGICVEPMPTNVKLLKETSLELGYSAQTSYGSLHIFQAAVVANASLGETVSFSVGEVGSEGMKIGSKGKTARVPMMTVDTILDSLDVHADILIIDTEGYDAEVLKGARRTLAKTRYLEFEVHRDFTPWKKTSLRSVVEDLNQQGFDCYWAGNNGKLTNIEKCWHKSFDIGTWANAACVKRADAWSKVLERFQDDFADLSVPQLRKLQ